MSDGYEIKDSIAFLRVKASPFCVNSRSELIDSIAHANTNRLINFIVLVSNGKNFSTGLTTLLYLSGDSSQTPTVNDVASCIERSSKPVIGVLSGKSQSAGLEATLGCHFRIACPGAQISFSEVRIGLIPNGGATQRLPRIIGLKNSLSLLTTGRYINASQALELGLIDAVCPKDEVQNFVFDFMKKVDDQDIKKKLVILKTVAAEKNVKPIPTKSIFAKHCAHEAVLNSTTMTFYEGILKEQEIFLKLLKSEEFKAFVYASKAEGKTHLWHRKGKNIKCKPQEIKSAGVVGLGTMGSGIAVAFVSARIPLTVMEQNPTYLKNGIQRIHQMIEDTRMRGMITVKEEKQRKNLISPTSDYASFKDCDIVVEAVFEKFDVKRIVFSNLDKFCKPSAMFFSNTSAFNIDEIAALTNRPSKVMGTHFFVPSHIMKLLENICGSATDDLTLATGMHMGNLLDKVTVLVGNCPGFVGNRMYFRYLFECDLMLEEGLFPIEVDKALEAFGLTFGRYYVADLSGTDVLYFVYQNLGLIDSKRTPTSYNRIAIAMFDAGRYGQKSGAGFYDYSSEAPTSPKKSEFVHNMILKIRKDQNIVARKFSQTEIVERALYSLINEGFKILEEGMASSAMDVDLVWLHGYSWPRSTGGPMYYAYTRGLSHICARIKEYNEYFKGKREHWVPSKMLLFLAGLDETPPIEHWVSLWKLAKM